MSWQEIQSACKLSVSQNKRSMNPGRSVEQVSVPAGIIWSTLICLSGYHPLHSLHWYSYFSLLLDPVYGLLALCLHSVIGFHHLLLFLSALRINDQKADSVIVPLFLVLATLDLLTGIFFCILEIWPDPRSSKYNCDLCFSYRKYDRTPGDNHPNQSHPVFQLCQKVTTWFRSWLRKRNGRFLLTYSVSEPFTF